MQHPFFAPGPMPRIFGHRGFVAVDRAAAGVLENSREAIAAAVAEGAEYVETDCHLTADGEVVLFHDSTLARTLGDPRRVSAVTRGELDRLMAGRGGLLTLAGALAEFPDTRFNIDVKSAEVAFPAGSIIGAQAPSRVLIGSFSDRARLEAVAAAHAAGGRPATGAGQAAIVRVLAAVATRSRRLIDRALAGIDALQIPERQGPVPVLTERLLGEAHARGVEVHMWTVNDPHRMRELAARGIDGIITDRTDLAVEALRS
ncbi:glycerophosphodiester phosphodiesterase family protein [Leucobacter albus]|uniref:Glycerophosphodiester phosphodiesterase family protein n=1 Tax=Leucobacter albus TaxID=272210 RepID=A0ABW3TR33_9MICO